MHVKRACVDQALLFATPAAVHNQPLYPGCDLWRLIPLPRAARNTRQQPHHLAICSRTLP